MTEWKIYSIENMPLVWDSGFIFLWSSASKLQITFFQKLNPCTSQWLKFQQNMYYQEAAGWVKGMQRKRARNTQRGSCSLHVGQTTCAVEKFLRLALFRAQHTEITEESRGDGVIHGRATSEWYQGRQSRLKGACLWLLPGILAFVCVYTEDSQ